MANAANVKRVIAAIRGETVTNDFVGFNMGAYIGATLDGVIGDKLERDCGTVACIAGHAFLLATGASIDDGVNAESDDIDRIAADYLGIDMSQAAALFYDLPVHVTLGDVTAVQAIDTLERLAVTGEVFWDIPQYQEMRMAA